MTCRPRAPPDSGPVWPHTSLPATSVALPSPAHQTTRSLTYEIHYERITRGSGSQLGDSPLLARSVRGASPVCGPPEASSGLGETQIWRSPSAARTQSFWVRPRYNPETLAASGRRNATKPLRGKGFRGTPGGTRTPNLLIRRTGPRHPTHEDHPSSNPTRGLRAWLALAHPLRPPITAVARVDFDSL